MAARVDLAERQAGLRPTNEALLIIGGGVVGGSLTDKLSKIRVYRGRKELDVLDKEQLKRAVGDFPGRVVVNASGNVEVSKADETPEIVAVNIVGVQNLIEACRESNKTLVHFSSETIRPYYEKGSLLESYFPENPPEGVYAKSKWEAEKAVRESDIDYVILRIAYPSRPGKGFLERLRTFNQVFYDQLITPTWTPDLVEVVDNIRKRRDLIGRTLNVASPTAISPLHLRELLDAAFGVEKNYKIGSLVEGIANGTVVPARPLDARLSVIESQVVVAREFTPVERQVKVFAAAATL